MAQSTKIQAACLLLLLIASLTSSSLLQQLVKQPEALQPRHRTEARADMSFLLPNRKKRDTNFPICVYCCGCCNRNQQCGFCCKT